LFAYLIEISQIFFIRQPGGRKSFAGLSGSQTLTNPVW
jgi:hypothetical protein